MSNHVLYLLSRVSRSFFSACFRLQVSNLFNYYGCSSATNRLITAKDHASVQINVGHLDENGIYNGQFTTFALSGFVRAQVFIFLLFY